MRLHWRGWALGLMVLLAAACQSKRQVLDAAAADAWAKVIVAHTTGLVPRRSEIRVLFASDVAAASVLGDGTLKVEPAVQGELALRGPRELVLVPKSELAPGKSYRVTLTGKDLSGLPEGITPYQFEFRVQTPQYGLSLADLESDPADDQRMIQRGVLATADAEDSASVEKMLRASYRGNALQPAWTHSGDGRTHEFAIPALDRQAQASELALQLAGAPIGAGREEQRTVSVPAAGQFSVVNAQAVETDGRKQIQVSFSDALDDGQNVSGLVQLSAGGFTSRIEANRLVLYPDEDVNGDLTVTLEPGIRNRRGERLATQSVHALTLASQKPQVRFVGNGSILPKAKQLTVAFEAVGARSVLVTATRVFPENIPQYLQVSALGEASYEIGRVGRYLWRKRVTLPGPHVGRWERYDLDVTELMEKYPGSLLQLSVQLTPQDSAYRCDADGGGDELAGNLRTPEDREDANSSMETPWRYEEEFFGVAATESEQGGEYDYEARWRDRGNPCRAAYYLYGYNDKVQAQRNLIASNLGLLAKADARGRLLVSVTHLDTAQSQGGVALELRNFQNQPIGKATTDGKGMATLEPEGTPFLLVAGKGDERGYLRLGDGNALPVSHFDVGGETVQKGLKGAIYGERGVWRPGDALPLTFVVFDRDGTLPANHPATLELLDPRGRVTQTLVNAKPVDGFYRFDARTAADAPTGNWTARVALGGATFTRRVKVETVMPNRLRVDLDLGAAQLGGGQPLRGKLSSEWLSGASAASLRADVNLSLTPTTTQFEGYNGYVFDDPARDFSTETQQVFAGELGVDGSASIEKVLQTSQAPGMLTAGFTSRVFERGGAFSINYQSRDFAPYSRFVGVKIPAVNRRNTLPVDQEHAVDLAAVTAQGAASSGRALSVKLYKVEWRWWWDREEGSLASFVARESSTRVREGRVTTDASGRAQWKFSLAEAQWGRYLLRVCDEQGGHCAGTVFYVDSPYWSEDRDVAGPAATMLELGTDKTSYQAGETATVQLPQTAQGRALVTIENGSGVIEARWVDAGAQNARLSIPVTAAMSPTAYVAVTMIQPHAGKRNDRPIRLYGVVPLQVTDAATQLKPVLQTDAEWRPEAEVSVKVSEATGKAMTYTLAVVDEGLLALTNFRTPDLHGEFFRREALGVKTWDLFDDVSGAYGAELERLLALGGSDGADPNAANKQQSRFVPVARVLGPFQLPAGKTQEQKVKLPRYVGAVRVMVVAGGGKPTAYGSTDKSVPVRQPLMILPTMPRVVGPGEEIAVPVSVFAMQDTVRDVRLTIEPDSLFEVVGDANASVSFTATGEKIALLRLRVADRVGRGTVRFNAVSGSERAADVINIEVRAPNPPSTRVVTQMLQPGASWQHRIEPHGMPGTNQVALEVSRLPPLNLARRLQYLISYPYGCLEQTTSSVFPQLYLGTLAQLDEDDKRRTEANIRAGIDRLRGFQLADGNFSYWPGGQFVASDGYQQWSAVYASHFLIEAERMGHAVPAAMRSSLLRQLQNGARNWTPSSSAPLQQAYRLFVLARAGQAEVGAMNRLREATLDPVERWVLAAAYQLAGLGDAARALMPADPLGARDYRTGDTTFGTPLRDHALVLQSLVILNQVDRAEALIRAISTRLSEDRWLSTQETAYALMAMSQLAGARSDGGFAFTRTLAGRDVNFTSTAAVHRATLEVPDSGTPLALRNGSQGILFATLTVRGTPAAGNEDAAAAGLSLTVGYSDAAGNTVDVASLPQGEDVTVDIVVRNTTRENLRHLALTHIVPSGWEIANERLFDAAAGTGERAARDGDEAYRNDRAARADHVDIRDDRVMQFFDLPAGATIRFETRINAAYQGEFYLPGIVVEAMYDATHYARTAGRRTQVVAR